MTTFAFPTLSVTAPTSMTWGMKSNTFVHSSSLSGQVQTVELPGARWYFEATFSNLVAADRALMEAFLAKLRGQANRFTSYDWSKPAPLGTMRGSLTTSGSIAAGAVSATITGGAGQASTTLKTGDKLNIGGELKIVTADATANGSGVITVTVEPPFRGAITNGSSVTWDRPTALFIMNEPQWTLEPRQGRIGMASFSFDATEAFA